MKKLLGIVVLGLLLSGNAYTKDYTGTGEIKLSDQVIRNFQHYIQIKKVNKKRADPGIFMITLDGSESYYYYCSHNLSGGCLNNMGYKEMKRCKDAHKQECALFAKRRVVVWKNGINDGKKKSRFNSKMTNSEIKAKLTELGFYGNAQVKKTTNNISDSDNLTEKLKALNELYKSGALTKEEFTKAKNKLLN
jgi:hypothetical protein